MKVVKRWVFYLIGVIICAGGVSCIIASNMGTGSWDAVAVGFSHILGGTTGTWVILVGVMLMLVNAWLFQKRPDVFAFITVFLIGLCIDFFLTTLLADAANANLSSRIRLYLLGFVLTALGGSIYLQATFAPSPIDNLMLAVRHRFHFSLSTSRLLCEMTALVLALVVSGPVSYGTVFFALCIGPSVSFLYTYMEKWYNRI